MTYFDIYCPMLAILKYMYIITTRTCRNWRCHQFSGGLKKIKNSGRRMMLMSKNKIIKFEFLCILFLICFYNIDKIENAVQVLVKLYELIKGFIIALLAWIAFSNLKNIWQRKLPSRSPIYNITFIYIFMQDVLLYNLYN